MIQNIRTHTLKLWQPAQQQWTKWTLPSSSLHDEEAQRRAKLTASVILLMLPFLLLYTLSTLFYWPIDNIYTSTIPVVTLLFATLLLYAVSRTIHYYIASLLVIAILSIYPFLFLAARQKFDTISIYNGLMWLLVPILLGSVLLPLKQVVVQIVLILSLILLMPFFNRDLSAENILPPFIIISVLATLIMVFQRNLQNLERDRHEREKQLYLEVKKSEEQFRILFEQAPIGMSITRPDGRFIDVNRSYCQTVGYSAAELKSMNFFDITHPEDIANITQMKDKLLNKEAPNFTFEKRYIHKNGYAIDALVKVSLEESTSVEEPRVLAQIIDISDRKAIETKLKESQQLLEGITENSSAIMFVKDLDGRYILVNKAFENAYLQDRSQILGKTDFELFPTATAVTLRDADETVLQNGSPVQVEETIHSKKGIDITYLSVKFPLLDADGTIYGITGISTDITEQKKAEFQLRKQKVQLEALRQVGLELTAELHLKALLDSIILNAVNILEADSGALWLHQPEKNALKLVANHHSTFPVGMLLEKGNGVTGQAWESGKPSRILNYKKWEGRLSSIKEEDLAHSVVAVPIFSKGQVIGVIDVASKTKRVFTQDNLHLLELFAAQATVAIENARLHNQLKEHSEELERSNKELQDFAYAASHDLQEPLRKIQTFSDRLQAKYSAALDQRGLDYLVRMSTAASRMQTLIVDLLVYSRVTTQAQPFINVDLNEILHSVIEGLELLIDEKQAKIIIRNTLPIIEADQTQMTQLFQNLVSNAIKFIDEGKSPEIHVESTTAVDSVAIAIADNGIGFEEKYAERIFGVFQRLHGREKYGGTGVGLAICQKIVKRHKGTITVSSQINQGSTFIITLPIKQAG